jgi:hypothetical protein
MALQDAQEMACVMWRMIHLDTNRGTLGRLAGLFACEPDDIASLSLFLLVKQRAQVPAAMDDSHDLHALCYQAVENEISFDREVPQFWCDILPGLPHTPIVCKKREVLVQDTNKLGSGRRIVLSKIPPDP